MMPREIHNNNYFKLDYNYYYFYYIHSTLTLKLCDGDTAHQVMLTSAGRFSHTYTHTAEFKLLAFIR